MCVCVCVCVCVFVCVFVLMAAHYLPPTICCLATPELACLCVSVCVSAHAHTYASVFSKFVCLEGKKAANNKQMTG